MQTNPKSDNCLNQFNKEFHFNWRKNETNRTPKYTIHLYWENWKIKSWTNWTITSNSGVLKRKIIRVPSEQMQTKINSFVVVLFKLSTIRKKRKIQGIFYVNSIAGWLRAHNSQNVFVSQLVITLNAMWKPTDLPSQRYGKVFH